MIKIIVYKIVSFFLDNWKRTITIIVAIYFITMGGTMLAGAKALGIAGLPGMNMTLPM